MRIIALPGSLLGTMFILLVNAAPAHAQATGTWVSGVGDDANPCSRTAPCKTFAGAISKTAVNGEIRCMDNGAFGAVTITKSMTIDCHDVAAFVLAAGTTGITINLTTNPALDPLQTVRLRNININGTGPCGAGCGARSGIRGINILSARHVFLDDMRIEGFVNQGVQDARTTAGGRLYVRNSIVRDNGAAGVTVTASGSPQANAVIEGSHLNDNGTGVAAAAGNMVMVSRSVMTGNVTSGVHADPGAFVSVDDSVISSNGTGVTANGGSTVRLSNNNVAFNGTGINGATTSFGNNRIYPNVGTAPTPAGGDTQDKGQQ